MYFARRLPVLWPVLPVICAAQQASDFEGTWVLKLDGQPILKLTLAADQDRIAGALTMPTNLTFAQNGEIQSFSPEAKTRLFKTRPATRDMSTSRSTTISMCSTAKDPNHAVLTLKPFRSWPLERAANSVTLVSKLEYSDEIRALREHLKAMVKDDQDARLAFDAARIDAADDKDRFEVLRIRPLRLGDQFARRKGRGP